MVDCVDTDQTILDQPVLVAVAHDRAAYPVAAFPLPDVPHQSIHGDLRELSPLPDAHALGDVLLDGDEAAILGYIDLGNGLGHALSELAQVPLPVVSDLPHLLKVHVPVDQ